MQTHEEIMKVFWLFCEEQKRREEFKKQIIPQIKEYEYYQLNNMVELEDKSQIIIKQELLEVARKSMEKTEVYQCLEKKDTETVKDLISSDEFKIQLYYLDNYNNILKKVTSIYWKPTKEEEKLLKLLIQKSMTFSEEKTFEILQYIKKWESHWNTFIEKQILYYKLDEKLEKKNKKEDLKKI